MAQKSKAVRKASPKKAKPAAAKRSDAKLKLSGKKPAVKKTAEAKPAPAAAVAKPAAKSTRAGEIAKAKAALKAEAKPRSRKISVDIDPSEATSALSSKWSTLYKKAEQIEAKPYNMKAVFEEKTAILHKVLGWGYILANRNDRLEVLFKDGIKYLISNYKP